MRQLLFVVGLGLAVGMGIGIGCAAGNARGSSSGGDGGSGGESTASSASTSTMSGVGGFMTSDGGTGGASTCAKFTEEATQAPAAMLFVQDMSASMNKQQKWGQSQLAIVSAIDKDVFDSMSLGLITFPSSFVDPPQCFCDYACEPLGGCDIATCKALLGAPGVSCGVSFLPQVAIAPAGKDKSNAATGVRKTIYDYLTTHNPLSNGDDGSPIYDALSAAYGALKLSQVDRRMAILITDGGFSCTSLASPPRPGYSDGACDDWEIPDTVNDLISKARTDASKPINTFVVGVPGANSAGAAVDGFATPPYKMRLALSTYAVSGSPDTVDAACDKAAVFTQNGPEPAAPCHIDLSAGGSFDADALANAITALRGKALGCVYDLPLPPPGETIDPTLVNVNLTIDGVELQLPKRSNPADDCLVDACWDYNAKNQVEILGKGCADLSSAKDAKVDIVVGCMTVLK